MSQIVSFILKWNRKRTGMRYGASIIFPSIPKTPISHFITRHTVISKNIQANTKQKEKEQKNNFIFHDFIPLTGLKKTKVHMGFIRKTRVILLMKGVGNPEKILSLLGLPCPLINISYIKVNIRVVLLHR